MISSDIRKDFPLFRNNPDIAYLDNAATTQKPQSVLDAVRDYYEHDNANPLRGLYDLAVRATEDYEMAREKVAAFLGAKPSEIVFTRNATEGLNFASHSIADAYVKAGDEILITIMEHHSNLLVWQQAAKRLGAKLVYIEPDEEGFISEERFRSYLTPKTKLVAMAQISNVLGVKQDIKALASIAHENGALFIADGAQSVPHIKVDVKDLGVDALAFSGHKMLGPMGIGALYIKDEVMDRIEPFFYGGEMIEYVTRDSATYAEKPHCFEAGTVNAGGAVGLAAAIDYYEKIGFEDIMAAEEELCVYTYEKLMAIPYVSVYGPKEGRLHNGILTFRVEGVHPHDISQILSSDGVCIRAGHHCAQPLMQYLGISSSARVSFSFYNTKEEADRFVESVASLRRRMGYAD